MPVATKSKRIVRQKAKGPVDPGVGNKVRELRTSRGMTQAQLAGPDFSKGFISLLETGRTRVSLRAAQILAGRLGVEVTDLLSAPTIEEQDLEFMLLRAEQELRGGDRKVAMDIAATWSKKATGVLRARFQRLHARALIETSRSPEAVKLLDEALRAFRSLGAKEFVGRTLYDMARAHARVDAIGEGVKYALDAEQSIERGDVIDRTLELEIHQFLAGSYYVLGDVASAQIRAERARAIAEDAADPQALAKLYFALSFSRYEEGDKEAALAYARKSLELWESLGNKEQLADTWNTLGWLFIQREQYSKANEALDKAERLATEHGFNRVVPHVIANRGAIALARGNAAEAQRLSEEAIGASRGASTRIKARSQLLRARAIAAGGGSVNEVRKAFDEAIAAHKDESARERARAHQFYADVLNERNQKDDAYAQVRKALELVGPKV